MDEWLRTEPDIVIYVPESGSGETNQHLNVVATPAGTLLATWTTAAAEGDANQRAVFSRSTDSGRTWSLPQMIDGPAPEDDPGAGMASWQFLIQCPGVPAPGSHRIWCFYVKNVGVDDARAADTGVLRGRYSDDDGLTWSTQTFDLRIEPNAISSSDPSVPPVWIVYQNPTPLPDGCVLAGFTRWASNDIDPGVGMLERDSEVCWLRFENILTEPDPGRLIVTTWPRTPHGLRVESPFRPGISIAQEPTAQPLADGRLISVFRTARGAAYFSTSNDGGRSWREPDVLCYEPGGEPVLNPLAPCPLYRLRDGRYLLVFFNNDGSGHGGRGPMDAANVRNPVWVTVGRETPGEPHQPIRFGRPRIFADTGWTPAPGTNRTQVGTYCSFVEDDRTRLLFYPDRKHYLLAKQLSDEFLGECSPGL